MKKDEKVVIFFMILITIGCLFFSGCSLVKPFVAAVTPTVSTPQEMQKTNNVTKCKGEIKVQPDGSYYCTDGFYSKESGSSEKERKLTFFEKVRQNVYKFFGRYLIVMILLFIFAPSIFYYIIGKQEKALKQIIAGVQKARKEKIDLNVALDGSQDEEVKQLIAKLKTKFNI